jgi:hypothetical protein
VPHKSSDAGSGGRSRLNGWSPGDKNTRFQTAAAAGLTAAQIPSLKLKWVFGVPKAAEMHSQPTVASGRVFFGSDAGYIYSLDAKTGCVYWAFHADSGTRTAPTIAPIQGQGSTKYAVYFVDVLTARIRARRPDRQAALENSCRSSSAGEEHRLGNRLQRPDVRSNVRHGNNDRRGSHIRMLHVPRARDCSLTQTRAKTLDHIRDSGRSQAERKKQRGRDLIRSGRRFGLESSDVDPKRRRIYVGTGNGVSEACKRRQRFRHRHGLGNRQDRLAASGI